MVIKHSDFQTVPILGNPAMKHPEWQLLPDHVTSGTDLNATEVLRFSATDGVYSSVTNHTITADEIGDGGLFEFNITLGPIPGDVNDDEHLTTADVAIVLKMAVSGEYSEVADVSGDRAVTSLDALMILQEVGTAS